MRLYLPGKLPFSFQQARKQRSCWTCSNLIRVGEVYLTRSHYLGDRDPYTHCPACIERLFPEEKALYAERTRR